MKQPELGKKISQLRKAKGLTQEELVEKCNLNVRTIQRIEAGEVTPRSYTIKALFEALDFEISAISESFNESKTPWILYAGFAAGILYFFASIFEISMEGEYVTGNYSFKMIGFVLAKSISFIGYALFIYGWIRLLNFYKNDFLNFALWTMLAVSGLWFIADLLALFTSLFEIADYYIVKVSSFGFCYSFMGIGYLAYKNQYSNIPVLIGALTLVAGILIFSGIGAFLGLIPLTLAEIGQLGLMIYWIQKIGGSKTPGPLSFAESKQ
ncbi:helix-turn-helix domain-containing protein [Algoriphagus algorifonticola]|uniref:helix-turn-helix domain-containing protein n=1 Tax=Algoriphagus algorifonticola TaxID=2593007 RepID=UPI0011A621CF|nr:helix-turn-helix transcriptional regulator [Algoriphagus algorifonticola]